MYQNTRHAAVSSVRVHATVMDMTGDQRVLTLLTGRNYSLTRFEAEEAGGGRWRLRVESIAAEPEDVDSWRLACTGCPARSSSTCSGAASRWPAAGICRFSGRLVLQGPLDRVQHPVDVGQESCSTRWAGTAGRTRLPAGRRLQRVEALLGDRGGDLGAGPRDVDASCTTTMRPVSRRRHAASRRRGARSSAGPPTCSEKTSSSAAAAAASAVFTLGP